MIKTADITRKLNKLATKLDEIGMISEADRIDTISKLLAPGEVWSCPIDLEDDPMDNFFDFLKFTKDICDNDSSYRRGRGLKDSLKPRDSSPGDKVVEWLEDQHKEIIEGLEEDLADIN